MLTISLPFPYVVFLPVYLIITSKIKNFNIYNTVFILLMLAILSACSALPAMTVTKERIEDSLALSLHYNKLEKVLGSKLICRQLSFLGTYLPGCNRGKHAFT
jgi:hypothetical protein